MRKTKRCPHCNKTRRLDAFALRRKGGEQRQSWCRSCIAGARRARKDSAVHGTPPRLVDSEFEPLHSELDKALAILPEYRESAAHDTSTEGTNR